MIMFRYHLRHTIKSIYTYILSIPFYENQKVNENLRIVDRDRVNVTIN